MPGSAGKAAFDALARSAGGAPVCLGHDWLVGMRGGERVLELHCKAFPDAPIATIVGDGRFVSPGIASHRFLASPIARIPGAERRYRSFLPLLPAAAARVKIPPETKLLLTTSHCVAKGFRKPAGAKHVCVCFSPMRYAWLFYEEYFGRNPLKAAVVKPVLAALRAWDARTAAGVDRFVAISRHVADRIKAFYGRDSAVVYPPVDLDRCTPGDAPGSGDFDLVVSALVPYKRVDLAVKAYSRMGRKLKIVGAGGCEEALRREAGPSVEFLGRLPDSDVTELYRRCRLLVFPGEEDYGIVPLEAQACGRPVVAFGRGGALETVNEGVSGTFFGEQTVEALEEAVERAAAARWDPAAIRRHAEKFGPAQYLEGLAREISAAMEG
ncbi:MAG: glycosyltransferase [Kiritimatiellae bacterium]|nr:glycosyltransferase [Kiritimatiellia bacterium]